jgi:hypothetical protein
MDVPIRFFMPQTEWLAAIGKELTINYTHYAA